MLKISRRKVYIGYGRPPGPDQDFVNFLAEEIDDSQITVMRGASLAIAFRDVSRSDHQWILELDHGTMSSIIDKWVHPDPELAKRLKREQFDREQEQADKTKERERDLMIAEIRAEREAREAARKALDEEIS